MSTQKEREHNSTPYLVVMIASTKHEKENQCPDDDRLSDDVNRISHCLSMIALTNPGETASATEEEEKCRYHRIRSAHSSDLVSGC